MAQLAKPFKSAQKWVWPAVSVLFAGTVEVSLGDAGSLL